LNTPLPPAASNRLADLLPGIMAASTLAAVVTGAGSLIQR
jgi:hypothetical protein